MPTRCGTTCASITRRQGERRHRCLHLPGGGEAQGHQSGAAGEIRPAEGNQVRPAIDLGGWGTETLAAPLAARARHNVPQAFAQYHDKVGLTAVGYAKSEPFFATVKVGGVPKQVMLQVFERRVLTYTADNDPAFQVEMGNIGQHYYQWRYCTGT